MPALPPVPEVIKAEVVLSDSSDTDVISRWFWQYSGTAPTAAQLNTLAQAYATSWITNFAPMYTAANELTLVKLTDLSSPSAAVGSYSLSHAGTRSGGTLPAGTAALLNAQISRRYRGGKPRVYLTAGATGDVLTAQTWATAFLTSLLTAWNTANGVWSASIWSGGTFESLVNVSYYEGFTNFTGPTGRMRARSTLRTGGPVVDDISSWSANTRFASQRRRNRP